MPYMLINKISILSSFSLDNSKKTTRNNEHYTLKQLERMRILVVNH
jgi:hypothetical protein